MSDKSDGVVSEKMIGQAFEENFMNCREYFKVENLKMRIDNEVTVVVGDFFVGEKQSKETQQAQGVIEAISNVFERLGMKFEVVDYSEHTLGQGKDADAMAYFGICAFKPFTWCDITHHYGYCRSPVTLGYSTGVVSANFCHRFFKPSYIEVVLT